MRRCCCCVSLQRGAITIGVLSMVCSLALAVCYGAALVTLEEHVEACRKGRTLDPLGLLPSCHDLARTTTLLAARVFLGVQVGVWLLFLAFSLLLVIAAVKERGGLMVPWLVLSTLVTAAVVWAGVRAALDARTLDLLACLLALLLLTYCCLVVRAFQRLIKKQALVSVVVPSEFSPAPRLCQACQPRPADRPPAYTAKALHGLDRKPPVLPTGLGIKY